MTHSFILKLERAREHLDSLQMEARSWINTEPYGLIDEPDPEPPPQPLGDGYQARRFRLNKVSTVPDRLSLIAGDCLFNLRSALDHLALALAIANTPTITDRQIQTSEFPVFGAKVMPTDAENAKIGCIASAAKTIIKSLQPHMGGHAYASHPLWQIHELNRIDKHRSLTVCVAVPLIDGVRGLGIRPSTFENFSRYGYVICSNAFNFEKDAVWTRLSVLPIDPHKDVNMNPAPPIEIVFDKGSVAPLEPVIPRLKALCDFVSDVVIAQLTKFL